MGRRAALAALVGGAALGAGCVSLGASVAGHAALDGTATRGAGGALMLGTLAEIVEDRAIASLTYARDRGPLDGSTALGLWGVRVGVLGPRGRPGLYLHAAYGDTAEGAAEPGTSLITGAGVLLGGMRPTPRGRALAAFGLGVVYRRQQQADLAAGRAGDFVGVEITVLVGLDTLGPMYRPAAAPDLDDDE